MCLRVYPKVCVNTIEKEEPNNHRLRKSLQNYYMRVYNTYV